MGQAKPILAFMLMSVMVTASAERQQVLCNEAQYYLVKLIEFESQTSAPRCGVFRRTAWHEAEMACKAKRILYPLNLLNSEVKIIEAPDF